MKARILVIDDEGDLRASLQERLSLEGYEVLTAPDGRKGVQLFQNEQVDLVITDVLMPEMDGLEVLRRIRAHSPTLPILVMSGGKNRDLDFLPEAKEFGATHTISKPFQLEDIVQIAHDLLDSCSHHTI